MRTARWTLIVAVAGCVTPAVPPRPTAVPQAPQPEARLLDVVPLAPQVTARVYHGRVDAERRCWTFVTDGLAARGRPELVLSIALRRDDRSPDYPRAAVPLMRRLVAADAPAPWTTIAVDGVLGRADIRGLAAIPAMAPAGVPLPAGALTVVPLTAAELEVAGRYGVGRVAGMLAVDAHHVPTAWWFDRDRGSVIAAGDADRSAWHAPIAALPGLSAVLDLDTQPSPGGAPAGRWRLRLDRARAPALAAVLRQADDALAAISVAPDPSADATLGWSPSHGDAIAEIAPGIPAHATVNLVGFLVTADHHGALLLEDGVVMFLSPTERDAIADGLEHGYLHRPDAASPPRQSWQITWR